MTHVRTLLLAVLLALPLAGGAQPRSGAEVRSSFSDAVKKVSPAVVNIFTKKVVQGGANPFAADPFFQLFFGNPMMGMNRDRVEQSLGSGVLVTAEGVCITNYHVIKDASAIRVVFPDKREFDAKLLNADPKLDIAVMKLELPEGERVPFITFGDSDTLEVGDVVLAVGNPFGVGQSVSMGIVSALGRTNVGAATTESFIQTDAAINPGNSGGALVDSSGRLIGINTAIFSRGGGSLGIGFAIPSNTVKAVVSSILMTGSVQRPWLGADLQELTPLLAEKLGLPSPKGALVTNVAPGSPSAAAGLVVGDVILTFNGADVSDVGNLNARVAVAPLGKPVAVAVWREGERKALSLTLKTIPPRRKEDAFLIQGSNPLNGYVVERMSPALAQELGLPVSSTGLVVVGAPSTLSIATLGLQPGDILKTVNRKDIATIDDLTAALNNRARGWEIVFQRGNSMSRLVIQ
jgi:Do/DeqQ family serine protease